MTQKNKKTETEPPRTLPTPQQITETILDLLECGEKIKEYTAALSRLQPDEKTSMLLDILREMKQAGDENEATVMTLQAARSTLEQHLENRDKGTLRHQIRSFMRENRLPIIDLAYHLHLHPTDTSAIVYGTAEIKLPIARKIVEFMELKGGAK